MRLRLALIGLSLIAILLCQASPDLLALLFPPPPMDVEVHLGAVAAEMRSQQPEKYGLYDDEDMRAAFTSLARERMIERMLRYKEIRAGVEKASDAGFVIAVVTLIASVVSSVFGRSGHRGSSSTSSSSTPPVGAGGPAVRPSAGTGRAAEGMGGDAPPSVGAGGEARPSAGTGGEARPSAGAGRPAEPPPYGQSPVVLPPQRHDRFENNGFNQTNQYVHELHQHVHVQERKQYDPEAVRRLARALE